MKRLSHHLSFAKSGMVVNSMIKGRTPLMFLMNFNTIKLRRFEDIERRSLIIQRHGMQEAEQVSFISYQLAAFHLDTSSPFNR
jgi:hypothetical protein